MDPNQENQGEGSAGENRQAIFTPQPEQPEVTPAAEAPTQPSVNLSHPYFSNHPTQTFNTDAGDIILNAGTPKPKQNKRPFIIGGIVLIVAMIIGVAILWLAGKPDSLTPSETTSQGVTNESRALLHRYINFLLYGNDSYDKPDFANFLANNYSLLQPGDMFAEQVKSEDLESARAYFNNLNSIYTEFSQAFFSPNNNTNGISEDYSRDAISNYFFEITKGSYLDLNQIISLYIQEGEDHVRDVLAGIFKSESDDATVKSLLELRVKQTNLYLQATVQADQAGCIADGSLELSCARSYFEAIGAEAVELTAKINKLEIQLRQKAITDLENIYYAFYPDEIIIEGANL